MSAPLVSCIMPTRNRFEYLEAAVRCFEAQTYENRELVIYEDGEPLGMKLLESWVKRGIRVRYKFLGGPRRSIGMKRNFCCEESRGELIAHFDDDDWSDPRRLEVQIGTLLRRPDGIGTGFRTMKFWDATRREAWVYCGDARFALGTSLIYRRDWWIGHQFLDIDQNEDGNFVDQARGRFVFAFDRDLMVARTHAGNSSKRGVEQEQFDQIEIEDLPAAFPLNL